VPDNVTPIFRMNGAQLETDNMINPLLGPSTGARQSPARHDGGCRDAVRVGEKSRAEAIAVRLAGGSLSRRKQALNRPCYVTPL